MTRILLLLILLFATINVKGQDEKDIRINIGVQWNMPERYFNNEIPKFDGQNSGYGFHIYPKWNYTGNLSFGLNMEFASVTEKRRTDNIDSFSVFSFSPTINYYFTKKKVRPFAGFGIGVYSVSASAQKLNLGIRPIVGIALTNKFELSLEYSKIIGDLNINPNVSLGFDNYYFALKGSYSIRFKSTQRKNKP